MTDLEKFKTLYLDLNIELKETLEDDIIYLKFGKDIITNNKLVGYNGFFTSIEFDLNSKFIKQGFWE